MIQPLKDIDGNYIPLDTVMLYDDDGTVVNITGFSYASRIGLWFATTVDGATLFPDQYHLNNPAIKKTSTSCSRRLRQLSRTTSSAIFLRTTSPRLRSAANECRVAKRQ